MRRQVGSGLQYIVYRMSETRVVKVRASMFQKICLCISWGWINPIKIYSVIRSADHFVDKSIPELKHRGVTLPFELLGNPRFGPELSYEQDFVTTLIDYQISHSLEENKRIFDLCIQNTFELWKYGIADVVFNFLTNNGVTNDAKVILIDLGELTFSKDEVANRIEEKIWLDRYSFIKLKNMNPELYAYMESEMNSKITLSNLSQHWGARLGHT